MYFLLFAGFWGAEDSLEKIQYETVFRKSFSVMMRKLLNCHLNCIGLKMQKQ